MGWIINGIKVVINVKNKLYAFGDEVRYKHYRNKICTLIRVGKMKYYNTFFENNMANMKKKTWQGKESINFYIDGKKRNRQTNLKVTSALEDFNNRNKTVKDGLQSIHLS